MLPWPRGRSTPTSEPRKLAVIMTGYVVGYSRLAGADEEGVVARLRALRSDLVVPAIAVHHGRVVKRTGDGAILDFPAQSTRCDSRSRCRTRWRRATLACGK